MSPFIAISTWRKKQRQKVAHGRRRGLRPLGERLSQSQRAARALRIEERALVKAMAQIKSRKEKKP